MGEDGRIREASEETVEKKALSVVFSCRVNAR